MSVKSAERVLRVFELLAQHCASGLTVKEISEALSFPQSSTTNLISTLYEEGYLEIHPSKRYKLGAKLIQLGCSARESLDIAAIGAPYLAGLMEVTEETVFMAILAEKELVYVAKIDNNRSIRTTARTGGRKPLYCTGLGKAFLAFLPETESMALLDSIELAPITANTITVRDELDTQLRLYREQGYAIDNEENEEGLYCLAAPVYDSGRRIQGAISVAGPKERMLRRKDSIVEQLLQAAGQISARLGG